MLLNIEFREEYSTFCKLQTFRFHFHLSAVFMVSGSCDGGESSECNLSTQGIN